MDFEDFVTEKVLKRNDRQEITVIYNAYSGKRFVKRAVRDDKRYIYKTLQKINHKNIPKIIDVKLTDGTIIIEEYIQGTALNTLMERNYKFTYKQIRSTANQLVSAMEELHKHNIIHRDIKPDNIIMDESGHIWLIDYDISRIFSNEARRDTDILGTVGYAPIEQFGIMPTDGKTDIYAFGATIAQLLEHSCKKGSLYKIAQKCKRLDPAERYQNIKQLKRALRLQFINPISVSICAALIVGAVIIIICLSNLRKHLENRYDEYIGTWRDSSGIILEMLNIEEDTARFNIKEVQANGAIRSIDNVTGIINGDQIAFSTVITDFGDTANGTLRLEKNRIYVDVYTKNMNTSSSICAAAMVKKDIQIKVNGEAVQLPENPPLMREGNIFVPAEDFPRALKLDSYYDSGFWAGDHETRITVMNKDTIIFFTSYDDVIWTLYAAHNAEVQTSYTYEYEQIPIISEQPAVINDTVYLPLKVLTEQFGADMAYDEESGMVNITADTNGSCKTEVEIKTAEDFDSDKAYDIGRLKYNDLTQTDGMPHYNHKGKFFMFLNGDNSVVRVYESGIIEIN